MSTRAAPAEQGPDRLDARVRRDRLRSPVLADGRHARFHEPPLDPHRSARSDGPRMSVAALIAAARGEHPRDRVAPARAGAPDAVAFTSAPYTGARATPVAEAGDDVERRKGAVKRAPRQRGGGKVRSETRAARGERRRRGPHARGRWMPTRQRSARQPSRPSRLPRAAPRERTGPGFPCAAAGAWPAGCARGA